MTEPMTNADNFWLCMDDPTNLMLITAFMEFEKTVNFERLQATIESRLSSFPRFRKRVVRPVTGIGVPSWETDGHFDVRFHIQRVALPPPGDKAELQEMVSNLMTTPLDPNKPLWQVHLIENYGKGCVVFFRIHHCVADGIALVHVLLSTADESPDAPWPESPPAMKEKASSFGPGMPFGTLIRNLQKARETVQKAGDRAVDELKEALSDPSHLLDLAKRGSGFTVDAASVLSKVTIMPSDPNTAFKGKLGGRKTVVWTEPMSLDKIKSVGRAISTATLNDVLIATVTGALRRYLKTRNYPVNELDLRVTIPVNIRKPGTEFELGNKFSLVFLALPVYIEDPILRLKEVKRRMDLLKESPDAIVNFGVVSAVGFLPPYIARKIANFFSNKASGVMTNVPGPRQPLYFAGRKISNIMFWVPRSGSIGLGISILSYDGKVTVGIAADEGLMPDPEVLLEGLEDEFNYLLDLVKSGKIEDDPLVLHDRYQETRCIGLKKNGEQCGKRALPGSLYCNVHGPDSEKEIRAQGERGAGVEDGGETDTIPDASQARCKALTKTGRRCKKRAALDSGFCNLHQRSARQEDAQEIAQILKELAGE